MKTDAIKASLALPTSTQVCHVVPQLDVERVTYQHVTAGSVGRINSLTDEALFTNFGSVVLWLTSARRVATSAAMYAQRDNFFSFDVSKQNDKASTFKLEVMTPEALRAFLAT